MNRDDVISMAREAGYYLYDLTETHGIKTVETDEADEWAQLARFAALVAAKEREACAQIALAVQPKYADSYEEGAHWAVRQVAARIRARGQA